MSKEIRDEKEPLYVDDERSKKIIEATNGVANVCFQCGTCTATCPWISFDEGPISIRDLMRRAQLGINDFGEELYKCLTCKECEVSCPRGVDITDGIIGLREIAFKDDKAPDQLENALWSVYEEENPWEQPASDRDTWLESVPDGIDVPTGKKADVLYYVGCSPSYDPSLHTVPSALVQLFEKAGVNYTVLGDKEVCCGDVVRQTGETDFFDELSNMNTKTFKETSADTIVTTSPHCAETFSKKYDLSADVVHYTEFLLDLVESGDLKLGNINRTVTFHDPCYLARSMAVIDEPRSLLSEVGIEIEELNKSGVKTLCCGGGGGNMWQERDIEERFADYRAKKADKTDSEELLTACPYCVQTLKDGVKKVGADISVRELSTVLLEAANIAEGN